MPPHVKACFEGDNGILAGLDKGKVWIDHSTTDYEQTQNYNGMVIDKGAQLLEAPITGRERYFSLLLSKTCYGIILGFF